MAASQSVLAGLYAMTRPLLFRLDAEVAHQLTLAILRAAGQVPAVLALLDPGPTARDPRLAVEAFGLHFPNRVGLAAGLDKNGVALPAWAALGFGHVEVGTVTPNPQPGNQRPRIVRLPSHGALINRMGFPNDGAGRVAARLASRRRGLPLIVGGNVGKGIATPLELAAADYEAAARVIAPHVDYLAVNVSSPNTPGLRRLQAPEQAAAILRRVVSVAGGRPVLLKLAPDIDHGELPEIVAAARAAGAAGLIATNTTMTRPGLEMDPRAGEVGGLSGTPMGGLALEMIARICELGGTELPVIAVGGIATPEDARARLAAGARLVQLYTGLVYGGPGLVGRLVEALSERGD